VKAERTGISDDPRVGEYQNPRDILEILHGARTVAVVGLSPDELRASNFVGFYLQRHGYRVVPVNPLVEEILGERAYPSIVDIPFRVDVVDVFRKPEAIPAIAKEAVAASAGALWLQFGVISFEGAEIASMAGLRVVMDRCLKVEHARYLGRMHWLGFNTWQVTARRSWSA
jgi:predicted CoA-binding protein